VSCKNIRSVFIGAIETECSRRSLFCQAKNTSVCYRVCYSPSLCCPGIVSLFSTESIVDRGINSLVTIEDTLSDHRTKTSSLDHPKCHPMDHTVCPTSTSTKGTRWTLFYSRLKRLSNRGDERDQFSRHAALFSKPDSFNRRYRRRCDSPRTDG